MYIEKGPFQPVHQQRALSNIVQARIYNQVSFANSEQWYIALLNLEKYVDHLKQFEKTVSTPHLS